MTATLEMKDHETLLEMMPSAALRVIAEKVALGERLSREEGIHLLDSEEADAVRDLADDLEGDLIFNGNLLHN